MEVWKDIPDYVGLYQASNFGRIRRIGVAKGAVAGRVLRSGKSSKYGHKNVALSKNSKPKSYLVHRLVALAFFGKPDDDRLIVTHRDGDPTNNRISNLKWSTPAENTFDQVLHGTHFGKHYGRKSALTDGQVLGIRKDHRSSKLIGLEYGISPATVNQIRRRETHKHLPANEGDFVAKGTVRSFSDDIVRAIRSDNRATKEIAKEYGCSDVAIWSIRTRRTYVRVSD